MKTLYKSIALLLSISVILIIVNQKIHTPYQFEVEQNFEREIGIIVMRANNNFPENSDRIRYLINLRSGKTENYQINKVFYDTGYKFIVIHANSEDMSCLGRFSLANPVVVKNVKCSV